MKKLLLIALTLGTTFSAFADGVYQIPNWNFDTAWTGTYEPGNGWNSFASATGTLSGTKSMVQGLTTKITGRSGNGVELRSKKVFVANANGNLTTGMINMGSSTATDASNYNYTSRSNTTHSLLFAGLPDSIECYAQFTQGTGKVANAAGTFILHGDADFKDPNETAGNISAYQMAKAVISISPAKTWTRFAQAFTYTNKSLTGNHYLLASFTTNPTPGASADDALDLDDVRFIYNSKLQSLTVNGAALSGFSKDKKSYTVDGTYTSVAGVADGVGATVETAFDATSQTATITVKGNNYTADNTNVNVYTVKFSGQATTTTGIAKKVAGTYKGKMYISSDPLTDASEPLAEEKSVILTAVDGKDQINFALYNFAMSAESGSIGNIIITAVPVTKNADNSVSFSEVAPTELTLMDGAIAASATIVSSTSSIVDKKLTANINVAWHNGSTDVPLYVRFIGTTTDGGTEEPTDTTKTDTTVVPKPVVTTGYQIPNGNFDTAWTGTNEPGSGWNSFASATGSYSTAKATVTSSTTMVAGRSGNAAQLKSLNMFIAYANGNLTTGMINMGSATPSNASNYNYTLRSDANHSLKFVGMPDSVECYAKFAQGKIKGGVNTANAAGTFILHGDANFRDPNETADSIKNFQMAKAVISIAPAADWTRFAQAFTYTQKSLTGTHYMLASFTTNPTPGGSYDDVLTLDDVKFIYNSQLSSLTINGLEYPTFNKNVSSYSIKGNYISVEGVADGVGATVETSYNASTRTATIVVKGNDWAVNNANQHVYTVTFTTQTQQNTATTVAGKYVGTLYISADPITSTTEALPDQKTVILNAVDGENKVTFGLYNFVMSAGTDPIGNIIIPNVPVTQKADQSVVFSTIDPVALSLANGGISATAAIDAATSSIADGKLTANINVIWTNGGNTPIYVRFVGQKDVTGISSVVANEKKSGVYTLSGVRVAGSTENLAKGIYIVNGKKIVVR